MSRCLLKPYLFVLLMFTLSCSVVEEDHAADGIRVIYDTDMGNDTDDILGLIMLHHYVDLGMVDLIGVCSSKEHPYSARYIDLLNTWYRHPDIPIGVAVNGPELDSIMAIPRYTTTVVDMEKDGKPVFDRTIEDYRSLMPAARLYRKLLAGCPDRSVVIIMVGMSTNLAALLATRPDEFSGLKGRELVERKVDYLCMMGGNFSEPLPECNIVTDSAASSIVLTDWPTKIVVSPFEVGRSIVYPAESFASDFNFVEHHPLIEAMNWYSPEPQNSPTWDMTAVLYAVEGSRGYFNLSEPGRVTLGWEPDIQHHIVTHFTPDGKGKHFYLSITPEQGDRILKRFLEIVPIDPNNNN
jgi:inosine-uridine nucleoside N-ribohydrolase